MALAKGCGDGDSPVAPPPDPPRPTAVAVNPATAGLSALGAAVQLTAEVRDQNGQAMTGTAVAWASSDPTVAAVDTAGLVTAVGNGTATITVTAGSASGTATVTVAQAPDSVEVSPAAATITALGDTLRLAAQAFDVNGQAVAEAEFSWETSADSVATVDASGLVKAVAEGAATIRASAGTAASSAEVTVTQQVSSVEVSPRIGQVWVGLTLQLAAEAFDASGTAVRNATFSWSSSDEAVATVDSVGVVLGVTEGMAVITVASGDAEATAEILVGRITDREALVALYEATGGPNWVNDENWLTDAPLEDWFGVRTNHEGRVVALEMAYWDWDTEQRISNNLSGPIPPELGSLTHLTSLNLSGNDLNDPIPAELSGLASLKSLNLGGNGLTGPVPSELGNLDDLEFLSLWGNDLAGPIPPELGNLADLTHLDLAYNEITGAIPAELGNLANLERLDLWGNDLSGPMPPELGLLTRLSRLGVDGNGLTGRIPAEIGNLANLESLSLHANDLTDPIPQSFLHLDRLRQFSIRGNDGLCVPGTSGFVSWLRGIEDWDEPESLCNAADVAALNSLYETAGGTTWTESAGWTGDGAVEDWYGVTADSLGQVVALDLSANGLAGRLPVTLGDLARMTELKLADNSDLAGRIPLSLTQLELQTLHYSGTGLCAPTLASFRDWLSAIPSHEGTGECPPFGAWSPIWEAYLAGQTVDATYASRLPMLFTTALQRGLHDELDAALSRLVDETPALPASSAAPLARLAAEVAETLGPYEWPEPHPWAAVFPGLPVPGARRVDGTVTVDASRSEFPADASRRERHLPLGFYALPGALVTIEVPAGHATGKLRVAVGELYDPLGDWGGWPGLPEWRRAPWLRREFAVTEGHTNITNAYGGSIALVVPADYELGRVQVTVRGAIPMAVYTDGESNAAEWHAALDGGAPQAIIQKMGEIRLVVSAERARGVDDPHEVAAFWEGFQGHHAELSGEPVPRAFESVWLFNPQVRWGLANANPRRLSYPLHGEVWGLLPGTAEGREYIAKLPDLGPQPHTIPPSTGYSPSAHGVDWWMFGHELGHQWQTEDWGGGSGSTSDEIGEVAVNLFTMYTLNFYVFGGDSSNVYTERKTHGCAAPLDHAALASRRWSTSDDCEKLALYRQLISEFGWEPMKAVFRSYYDPAYPRSTYGGALDGFAIRFSAIVQRDLAGFFRHWHYPLSESAAGTIRSFGFEQWLPPGW